MKLVGWLTHLPSNIRNDIAFHERRDEEKLFVHARKSIFYKGEKTLCL